MITRYRMVNPLLGVYYGIFTAAFLGLGILLLILEYMGTVQAHLPSLMTGAAFLLCAVIAVASFSKIGDEFFVSGRRVPAGLNGLIIFVVGLGGAGLSGLVGALFFWGLDGFGLLLGMMAGVMLIGVLFAAFIRKGGGYTLPTHLEQCFQSRFVGWFGALVMVVPACCFALAELSLIKLVAPLVFGFSADVALMLIAGVLLVMLLPGGVRSMSWVQCGLALVVLIGLIVPLVLISLQITNLPLAQFTYGSLIEQIAKFEVLAPRAEDDIGGYLPFLIGEVMALDASFLGGERPVTIGEKLAMFVLMAVGIAGMPSLLMRSAVVETAFDARKSFAWGAALLGFVVLTIPAYVIFFRYLIFDPQFKIVLEALPRWVEGLINMGLFEAGDLDGDGVLSGHEIKLARDGVFIGLPQLAGLSQSIQSLGFAALLSAAVAGVLSRVMVLSQYVVRDLNLKKSSIEADLAGQKSILLTRLVLVVVVLGLTFAALHFDFDAFQMFVAGLVFCALALFPCLVLSVWWSGFNGIGAVFSMGVGFASAAGLLVLAFLKEGPLLFGLGLFEAGCLALVGVFVCGLVAAKLGRSRGQGDLEPLNELRTPGGEALYDRHLRLVMPRRSSGKS